MAKGSKSPFSSAFTGDTASRHCKPRSFDFNKVPNEWNWGDAKSVSRDYGGTRTFPPPKDTHAPQKLGDPINQQGPNYHNDVKDKRLHGAGGPSRPLQRSAVYLGKNPK